MTNEEAQKMLIAKIECMKREASGIDQDCNYRNCDECELCYAQGTTGDQIEALNMAVKALRNSPTYLPSAQQWIPCSERLPDNDESVLISNNHGVTKAWWTGRSWTSIAVKKYKTVTAWMPLPEPYEGES